MQEINNKIHQNSSSEEIDIYELINILYSYKFTIISITSLLSIIGVIYSILLPNVYESKAVLSPVDSSSSISGALKSYSGLAGLAGIAIPTPTDESNSTKAITKVQSLSFFKNNIYPRIYLPNLMAVKSWDHFSNTISYDEKIISSSGEWIRDFAYPQELIPTIQESYLQFKKEYLNVTEDKKTGFITISIKHQSPHIAKEWVELLIEEINSYYRQKDKSESEKAVAYLNKEISMTSLSEVKQVIAELLQDETKKLALIEANQYYVFEYIDPPATMEKKSEPNRALICMTVTLLGFLLSIIFVLTRHYLFINLENKVDPS